MKRLWLSVVAVALIGSACVAFVLFGWTVNESHFDRPSQEFDELEAELEKLPGVDSIEKERWVEAPTFSEPTSWMSVTVDEAGLPGLLHAACSTGYPDGVTWSINVRTPAAAEVSLYAAPTAPDSDGRNTRCPDFGFDAVQLVHQLDRVAPGLAIQPTIWEEGTLTLVALEQQMPAGFTHLLPLVDHSDDLVGAAGLDTNAVVEINSANLGVVLEPHESVAYLALLTELNENRSVSTYWADGGGTPEDGIEKIQIVAPVQQRAAIEDIIRSSGLHIADLPLRFIEQ
ncbi:hypothetical protein ACPW96_23185 [Micromonospora sp. DT81.3]|uniref:hypothetical protein n=1 Tax=Micromonospora sp. DT81.3 TaxID=3416523 RepID=UPI003CF565E7